MGRSYEKKYSDIVRKDYVEKYSQTNKGHKDLGNKNQDEVKINRSVRP